MKYESIRAYNEAQSKVERPICQTLMREINQNLPEAESKIWHAHPVWLLDDNPVVGYSKLKDCIRLMFWSGQSFEASGLEASGSFKAAEARYTDEAQIDRQALRRWLEESRVVQWDYRNIAKRKGNLIRLR